MRLSDCFREVAGGQMERVVAHQPRRTCKCRTGVCVSGVPEQLTSDATAAQAKIATPPQQETCQTIGTGR